MPKPVDRHEVERLVDEGAQIVEVLEEESYTRAHLPGALNLPLWELDARAPEQLDPARATVVYCADLMCDLSPRGAHRLEQLGFADVYEYPGGKEDWVENGHPVEGEMADVQRAGDVARDVATCRLDSPLEEVAEAVGAAGSDRCVVVDENRVVAGVVFATKLGAGAAGVASDVMKPGPTCFRPGLPAHALAHHLEDREVQRVILTTSDGVLAGIFDRDDAD